MQTKQTRGYQEMELSSPKLHIDQIRSNKFFIGKNEPNPLNRDLNQAVSRLSAELYTKDLHFIMEIIQNAEDNRYPDGETPTLEFMLTEKDITRCNARATLVVFNNEVGFSRENMESLCSVGLSTKKGKRGLGFIGEKGIGFKSVFLVSRKPHVFSNGYRVSFDEEPDKDCGIGYIVPEWVDGYYEACLHDIQMLYGCGKSLPTTIIILPLKSDKVKAVRAQLAELHPELLLFLSKIKRLYVLDGGDDPQGLDNISVVSMCSETDHVELRNQRADSRMVELSFKGKTAAREETCKYLIWRQTFPVMSENRVHARTGVEELTVMLAFPCGKRLSRGTPYVGVFAFLPTALVTDFPFIIHADFILASSRESILLDNKWNKGILNCVPTTFLNAFNSCINDMSSSFSVTEPFKFIPVKISPIPVFDDLREQIRRSLKSSSIVPCSSYYKVDPLKLVHRLPSGVVRVNTQFRKIIHQVGEVAWKRLRSLDKYMLHPFLDNQLYDAILEFLGVVSADSSYDWHALCIETCSIAHLAKGDVYIELLHFIKNAKGDRFRQIPLLRYLDSKGSIELCSLKSSVSKQYNIYYSSDPKSHAWLSRCIVEFGCPDNMYFIPSSTQRELTSQKNSSLHYWINHNAGVKTCSASSLAESLVRIPKSKKDADFSVKLVQFLYHSHAKSFIPDHEVSGICRRIPIIDGSNQLRMRCSQTLVSESGSKWAMLFKTSELAAHDWASLGDAYGRSGSFAGESTPENKLLEFLAIHRGAVDLEGLYPPSAPLRVASSELTCEQAFLLLSWIRSTKIRGLPIPEQFIKSVGEGKWLKTYSGFNPPRVSILPDVAGHLILDMMKSLLGNFNIIDKDFYNNEIGTYADELKFLGAACELIDVQKLAMDRCRFFASGRMSREHVFCLLMFLGYLKATNMLDHEWLSAIKKSPWLKTSRGYSAPSSSILLPPEMEAEEVTSLTNLAIIDEGFYASKISAYSSELALLGVELDMEKVHKMVAENIILPLNPATKSKSALFILKCIRHLGSASSVLLDKLRNQPWLETSSGAKSPMECILPVPGWDEFLNGIGMSIIDAAFYGEEIKNLKAELKAVGVAVELDDVVPMVIGKFKSLALTSSLTAANVNSMLNVIRRNPFPALFLHDLGNSLSGVSWLKTRQGFKAATESILFNSKWGTISLFVDLPLLDDSFYGIGIYGYKAELEFIGVITDTQNGIAFVARGLKQPIDSQLVTPASTVILLDTIKYVMSTSAGDSLPDDFVTNLRKSQWLKTHQGYKVPEDCILLDPSWYDVLQQTNGPIIDNRFYENEIQFDILSYKDQLGYLGVKMNHEACSVLSNLLSNLKETSVITGVYTFLNKFKWQPELSSGSSSVVWIPEKTSGKGGRKFVDSKLCVIHDPSNLFQSQLFPLDKLYPEELYPMFCSTFGVLEFPSINHYLTLWYSWVDRASPLSVRECCAFWSCIVENWNSFPLEMLRESFTHVPVVSSPSEKILFEEKSLVFIPDNLLLQKIFSGASGAPSLFAWLPKLGCSPFVSQQKLSDIFHALGVRKLSESFQCIPGNLSIDQGKKVELKDVLIHRGLIKLIIGFMGCPVVGMFPEKRHQVSNSLLDLSVYECDDPIYFTYRLTKVSGKTLDVTKKQMVIWQKKEQRLLVDKSGYAERRTNPEFGASFAEEIANAVVPQDKAVVVSALRTLIQLALPFEFSEDAVDTFLMQANIDVTKEDQEFLDIRFPSPHLRVPRKRIITGSKLSGPLTPCKKQCK